VWYCDPAGDALCAVTVDFGDGCTAGVDLNACGVDHTYADNGTYTITATAVDDDGASTSTSVEIVVDEVDPWFAVFGSGTVDEGSTYALSYGFSDPGDDHISGIVVNWDDGHSNTYGSGDAPFTHVYSEP